MHFLKSEAYNLSPDEYLDKFKTPHQVISEKGSEELSQKDAETLEKLLVDFNDDAAASQNKQKVIAQFTQIIDGWLREHCSSEQKQDMGLFGIRIFGSYSLRVNRYDGDIDMLCLTPESFSRDTHFYKYLVEILKKNKNVRDLVPIPDSYVPLVKFNFYGVNIDLVMARISVDRLRQNPNFVTEIHRMLSSDRQLKCINGYRTSLYLLETIKRYRNFQVALKAIKMWAHNKGIYWQTYGFLGGAAFSLMLAKICQLYPNYSPLQLIDRFFFIYANWVWTVPVLISKLDQDSFSESSDVQIKIYTPVQPFFNAAYSTTRMTCFITKKYLKMGSQLIQQINKRQKQWKELFAEVNFFEEYRYFVQISVMGEKEEDFNHWRGNIESKIRKFVQIFETQEDLPQGVLLIPCPKRFPSSHPSYPLCTKYYLGIKSSSANTVIMDNYELDFTQTVKDFLNLLDNYPMIEKTPRLINIGFACLPREKIPGSVRDAFFSSGRQSEPQN